jgi:hypothetical protein
MRPILPARDERGLTFRGRLSTLRREWNSADSPNPQAADARQSKTAPMPWLTDAAGAAAHRVARPATKKPPKGENDMTTSYARRLLLGATIAASVSIGYAIGAQPHMAESITLLQSARAELAAATPNKGGHRERGLVLIDQAIAEVRAGIAFAGG